MYSIIRIGKGRLSIIDNNQSFTPISTICKLSPCSCIGTINLSISENIVSTMQFNFDQDISDMFWKKKSYWLWDQLHGWDDPYHGYNKTFKSQYHEASSIRWKVKKNISFKNDFKSFLFDRNRKRSILIICAFPYPTKLLVLSYGVKIT